MSAPKVDVLAVLDAYIAHGIPQERPDLQRTRAAVAELIEVAKQSRQALAWAAEIRPEFAAEYELLDAAISRIGGAA